MKLLAHFLSVLLLLCVTLMILLTVSATAATAHHHHHHNKNNNNKKSNSDDASVNNHCMYKCIIDRKHPVKQCEVYCHAIESYYRSRASTTTTSQSDATQEATSHSYWSHKLLIVDNGVAINEHTTPLSDDSSDTSFNSASVRFDKNLFSTPNAFQELFQWTHVLQQKLGVIMDQMLTSSASTSNAQMSRTSAIDNQQFHFLPMPIPLSPDQLNNHRFMSRLLDVVPASDIVYKETSPLMFSEAYKQFLLDVNIDQSTQMGSANQSPEVLNKVKQMEQLIENDMSQFLAFGEACYAAYENYLSANNLKKVSYTFDQFSKSNQDCLNADRYLADHTTHSKELSDYLKSLNPYDELFSAIGAFSMNRADWNFNREEIEQFKNTQVQLEDSGAAVTPITANIDIMRYYFNQDYFGGTVKVEESCEIANLAFSARAWREVDVSPKDTWFKPDVINRYRGQGTKSGRNYMEAGGLMQRYISKMLVAYKPVLKIFVSAAMKQEFITRSARMGYRPLEVGPFIFDRVEFTQVVSTNAFESYEMKIECRTQEPQVIGIRTKTFSPIPVPLPSTDYAAACQRGDLCMKRMTLTAIHRFYANGHHFFTTNFAEGAGKHYEGVAGHCLPGPVPGSRPLYRFYAPRQGQHLYTINYGEVSTAPIVKRVLFFKRTLAPEWNYEGVVCYMHTTQQANTAPLYRYYHRANDRLITTNYGELGAGGNGWSQEGVLGYIYPQSEVDQAISCCKCQ